MNILDCVTYFDEETILDLRLNILYEHVTKFIITGGSWGAILSLLYTIQYPNDIQLPKSKYNKSWGTWAGEPIGYVSSEKVLQLIHFKLGSKINKIIEFEIKDTSK